MIDIRPKDLWIAQQIVQQYLPKKAKIWVFGSRVSGKARRASDLDLAVDLGRPLTKQEKSQLFHAFEESDLPYKVDVVDLCSINQTLKNMIDQQKVALPLKPLAGYNP